MSQFKKLAKYIEYLRISFLMMLAYRTRYFVGITTYIIYISVNYFIWKAIFQYGNSIGRYSFQEMVTYIIIGWVSRSFYFNRLDSEIALKVVKGDLALDLLKPVDFQWMQYARTFGESLFRLILFTLPTFLIAVAIYQIDLPTYPITYFYFILSTFFAFMLFTSLNYLVGLLVIPLQNIEGITYAKGNLLLFFTGLIIPFDLLPGVLTRFLNLLPFGGISFIPLQIYLEKFTGQEIFFNLSYQLIWIIALQIIGRYLFTQLTRKIIIQGG